MPVTFLFTSTTRGVETLIIMRVAHYVFAKTVFTNCWKYFSYVTDSSRAELSNTAAGITVFVVAIPILCLLIAK